MVAMHEYYAYLLQYRQDDGSMLLYGSRIIQRFIIDTYTCIEEERFAWIKCNQSTLRCECTMVCLMQSRDSYTLTVGRKVILPSSFTRGPRYMMQNYQDAMEICRWVGFPDYFDTFTYNPKWPKIDNAFQSIMGQKANDIPYIVSPVFHIKLIGPIKDIKDESHFGKVKAMIYTIKFQKRGLPYAYIVHLWRSNTVVDIDSVVSAEIPNIKSNPIVYHSVCQYMIQTTWICKSKLPSFGW